MLLIPSFIGIDKPEFLPLRTIERIHKTTRFIVEREKTSRAFFKAIAHPVPQSDLLIFQLDKHNKYEGFQAFINEHSTDHDIGVISEAGLPGVADPGSTVVAFAHSIGLTVLPLAGSSSIFLALMASGMNGQDFRFHGYLPIDRDQRLSKLKEMEKRCDRITQIFMEAPYRNNDFANFLISKLNPNTKLCIACDLESESEIIISKKIKEWNLSQLDLHKRPCIYLIGKTSI